MSGDMTKISKISKINIEYMKSKIYPCKQVLSAKNNSFSIHL